jgi:hypothetical protein
MREYAWKDDEGNIVPFSRYPRLTPEFFEPVLEPIKMRITAPTWEEIVNDQPKVKRYRLVYWDR